MTLSELAHKAEKFLADNSPTILTAVGVTGTITTAYLTGKASFKAADIIRDEMEKPERQLYKPELRDMQVREKVELVWKLYIPPASLGTLTVVCIIGANRIGTRRAAAMAAVYSITEKAFAEYKEKIIEKIGEKKEKDYRDEVAQEQVSRNPASEREVVIASNGDVLCYDSLTGRYFQSNVEALRRAENDINAQIISHMYASLSDFYQKIGLASTVYSEEVGWDVDAMLELDFSTVLSEDGRPCVSINYKVAPVRGYYRNH